MAKPLVFQFGDSNLEFQIGKVDRSKLYGFIEREAINSAGERCELATLTDDGCTVIGRGGTGFGYLSADGKWCEKDSLKAVDLQGQPIQPVPSSFSAPVKLFETVTPDKYLEHNIRAVYQLTSDADLGSLMDELKRGTIFSFPYSYRGGLSPDCGFLLLSDDGTVFLAVGAATTPQFIGITQTAATEEDSEEIDEADLMDFDMI